MDRKFFMENRKALYNMTEEKGLLLLFSGHAPKKPMMKTILFLQTATICILPEYIRKIPY